MGAGRTTSVDAAVASILRMLCPPDTTRTLTSVDFCFIGTRSGLLISVEVWLYLPVSSYTKLQSATLQVTRTTNTTFHKEAQESSGACLVGMHPSEACTSWVTYSTGNSQTKTAMLFITHGAHGVKRRRQRG